MRVDGSVQILESPESLAADESRGPGLAYFGLFLMSSACFGSLQHKRQHGAKVASRKGRMSFDYGGEWFEDSRLGRKLKV